MRKVTAIHRGKGWAKTWRHATAPVESPFVPLQRQGVQSSVGIEKLHHPSQIIERSVGTVRGDAHLRVALTAGPVSSRPVVTHDDMS